MHIVMNPHFNDLLLAYAQADDAEERQAVEDELRQRFGAELTVLVVDMSGFTRLTRSHGLVHYLSMVRRMQLTAQPIIESYGGRVVKFEADNAFAAFECPGDAVRAAVALNMAMESANLLTPDELDIHLACGIDHGECLLPGDHDYFGNAVNLASKLGEDLGLPGQILVTDKAMAAIPEALDIRAEPVTFSISGLELNAWSIVYRKG